MSGPKGADGAGVSALLCNLSMMRNDDGDHVSRLHFLLLLFAQHTQNVLESLSSKGGV